MPGDHIREDVFPSDEEFDDEEDSDSESSTDVDAKLAEDDVFDAEFLKCYSALKKKDEKIYDKNVKFFNEKDSSSESGDDELSKADQKRKSTAPKMTLLDVQLNMAKGDDDDDLGVEEAKIDLNQPVSKSYYEKELEEIKKSIEQVGENIDSESDDDLLVVKGSDASGGPTAKLKKNKIKSILDKIENEEDDEDIRHLKEVWTDRDKLTEEDKYLRDYILNKRYLSATANDASDEDDDGKGGFFSKNLEHVSDADDSDNEAATNSKSSSAPHHSEEKDFDKIARIPRNSTKTIRDMVEKQEKKERRMKKLEKEKKRKKALKDADCEDIVGDLPTKFHYRETEPNDYGLTAEELLMATDEELDKWVSLHECVAYKSREAELAQKKYFESKRNDIELKKKIFKSIYGDGETVEEEQPTEAKASKKKRKRKRKRTESESSAVGVVEPEPVKPEKPPREGELSDRQKKKKRRIRGIKQKKFASVGVAPDRLLAYGLSKTKLKREKLL